MTKTESIQFLLILFLALIVYIWYHVNKQKKIKIKEKENEHKYKREEERLIRLRKTSYSKAKEIIEENKKNLVIQRKKTVFTDSYGKENTQIWQDKEIPYFIENHIYSKLSLEERENIYEFEIITLIEKVSKDKGHIKYEFNNNMNGYEFEIFCANKLEAKGWKTSKTKGGGDQGVDLIIEKNLRKIGVQCKKHSKPIGNKAVQEVKAGLKFYNLNEGIVISNNSYTKSAIELANINGIKLLHYLETENI